MGLANRRSLAIGAATVLAGAAGVTGSVIGPALADCDACLVAGLGAWWLDRPVALGRAGRPVCDTARWPGSAGASTWRAGAGGRGRRLAGRGGELAGDVARGDLDRLGHRVGLARPSRAGE